MGEYQKASVMAGLAARQAGGGGGGADAGASPYGPYVFRTDCDF